MLKLARDRVPIDTEQLKAAITGRYYKSGEGYKLEIYVPPIGRTRSNLNNLTLGLILESGGRNGTARRSQSQPKNPQGSPVGLWWTQFEMDAIEYLKQRGFKVA